jgi:hypothetical protein
MTALRRLASKIRKTAEPGSSVGAVSDYGLDDREIGVPSPAGAKDFSSNLFVQTGSGAHPASCTTDTGGAFPGAKRGCLRFGSCMTLSVNNDHFFKQR